MPFIFLATEVSKLFSHITKYISGSSEKCWKQMFSLKEKLGIRNILQLVEICIVLPILNAEVERVFSSFSRTMRKDR